MQKSSDTGTELDHKPLSLALSSIQDASPKASLRGAPPNINSGLKGILRPHPKPQVYSNVLDGLESLNERKSKIVNMLQNHQMMRNVQRGKFLVGEEFKSKFTRDAMITGPIKVLATQLEEKRKKAETTVDGVIESNKLEMPPIRSKSTRPDTPSLLLHKVSLNSSTHNH